MLTLSAWLISEIVNPLVCVTEEIPFEIEQAAEEINEAAVNSVLEYTISLQEQENDYIASYWDEKKVVERKLNAIGTDEELELWGYNVSKVLGVIYHEAGATYCEDELIYAVVTCIYNTSNNEGISPEEVVDTYGYATPMGFYSQRVKDIFVDVFFNGNICEKVAGAELFYNPAGLYYKWSSYHESQKYICTIQGVKFFEIVN